MESMSKEVLKSLSVFLRHLLEGYYDGDDVWCPGDLERQLNEIGVWRDRDPKPIDELPFLANEDKRAREVIDAYISYRREAGISRGDAVAEFVRESSYTWANRLLALRCMESRDIIDEVILQKEAYGWRSLQHHRLVQQHPEQASGADEGIYRVLHNEFIERAKDLPEFFNPNSPIVTLKPSVAVLKRCISVLSGRENINSGGYVSDSIFESLDALGWAYQYWNTEEKDRVFERVRTKKAKIEGSDIIPATQIYTESYMVKFLVQNSLGAQWMCMHPESRLSKRWRYYVKDADRNPVDPKPVKEITFLDPACGSGHFLLEAFDLFYDMYLEEGSFSQPEEICASILNNNLFGLDIDGRAVQIAQVSLWMRAKQITSELKSIALEEFRANIISMNIRLPQGRDHLEEFLRKHPEDIPLRDALEALFLGLSNVDEFGSLVQIEEPVERELIRLRSNVGYQTTFTGPRTRKELDFWVKSALLRVQEHFVREVESADIIAFFFGSYAIKGLEIFAILSKKYDVVATNPPFLGSGNMSIKYKDFIERNYYESRRDLYSTFLLRSFIFLKPNGRLGIITQQTWLFGQSYSDFRKNSNGNSLNDFRGILLDSNIEIIAHLGVGAFEDISGEVVSIALINLLKKPMDKEHHLYALKIIQPQSPSEKNNLLINTIKNNDKKYIFKLFQSIFLKTPNYSISYWLSETFLNLLQKEKLGSQAKVLIGLQSSNDDRFVRFFWETLENNKNSTKRWVSYEKGGGYCKWYGLHNFVIDWENQGSRLKAYSKSYLRNNTYYFKEGWTYTANFPGGSLGVRKMQNSIFATQSPGIFVTKDGYGAVLCSYVGNYLLRAITSQINYLSESYISNIPIPEDINFEIMELEKDCVNLKKTLMAFNVDEQDFGELVYYNKTKEINELYFQTSFMLHYLEGILNLIIMNSYKLDKNSIDEMFSEMGTPSGLNKLINGYDYLNIEDKNIKYYSLLEKQDLSQKALNDLKKRLHYLYKLGPNSKNNDGIDVTDFISRDQENRLDVKHIPAETFLEELAQKLEVHPISVYWILKEGIESEGWRCIPEEQRINKDRLTVIILRFLGHHWSRQKAVGELIPEWINSDGIIPITGGLDQTTLLEKIRERVAADLEMEPSQFEREFDEIMGVSLADWVKSSFFKHHVSQFKKRPIVWQLESRLLDGSGKGRGKRKTSIRSPAFCCLVYYHKLDSDLLRKIQTQYVNPLKSRYETELRTLEGVSETSSNQYERIVTLQDMVEELVDFDSRLDRVIMGGFDCSKLKDLCFDEQLDKWVSIDGIRPPPSTHELFHLQEREYNPDINDGVRVNIAPLQKAGLLSFDVLTTKDLEQAICDRAEWRTDERKWSREGKLVQPGWWRNK